MNYLEKSCEELDATVFSSDMMFDPERYAMFKRYLGRWNRAVEEHNKAEMTDATPPPPAAPVQPVKTLLQKSVAETEIDIYAGHCGTIYSEVFLPEGTKLYTTQPAAQPAVPLTQAWRDSAQWLRDNYQNHPNIASLCDAMVEYGSKQTQGEKQWIK